VVVHPLWQFRDQAAGDLADVIAWAATKGARRVRFLDSFNLHRRMSWVRAQRDMRYPAVDVATSSRASPAPLVARDIEYPARVSAGEHFSYGMRAYEKKPESSLVIAETGDWLGMLASGAFVRIQVRRYSGTHAPFMRAEGGARITPEEALRVVVIARALD
jgi:hypothetical protein